MGLITIQPGATLALTNSSNNNTNRILDSGDITLNGGTLQFLGINSGNSTETVDVITLGKGFSTITSTVGTGTASNVFTASSLVRNANATVHFTNGSGSSLGTTGTTQNRIVFTSAPTEVGAGQVTPTEGILPYAMVNRADFANYDGTGLSIRAFPSAEYYTDLASATANTGIVKLSNSSESAASSINVAGIFFSSSSAQTVTLGSNVTLGTGTIGRTSATTTVISGGTAVDLIGTSVSVGEGICMVAGSTLTFTTDLTSDDRLIAAGAGTISINGVKSYGGGTVIESGTVSLSTTSSTLGTSGSSVTWVTGTLTAPAGSTVLNQNFILSDSTVTMGSNLVFGASGGNDTFTVTGRNQVAVGTGSTTIHSQITGTGVFIKTGGQTLTLTDNSSNPGGFVLENNVIALNPTSSSGTPLGASSTQLTLEGTPTLQTNVSGGLILSNPLDIRSNAATLAISGSNAITFSGAASLQGISTVSVTNTSSTGVVFSGDMTGSGGIDKTSHGRLAFLTNPKTFTGGTRVQAGSLIIGAATATDVSLINSANTIPLFPTYLGSTGTTASLDALATSNNTIVGVGDNFSLLSSPIVSTEGIGILTANRANFTEGGLLALSASSYTGAGSGYDRFSVASGDLAVGGLGAVVLRTTGITTPGTFDDLVAASRMLGGPLAFPLDAASSTGTTDYLVQTTYGNMDVTIYLVSTTGAAIWTGSSSANWGTAANWTGNDLPLNGQSLVFPEGAANQSLSNDYPSLTSITNIVFTDDGYTLDNNGGSALSISGGIIDGSSSATANTINVPLTLSATSQDFRTLRSAGDSLNIGSAISGASGKALNIESPSGTVQLSGTNTYSGPTNVNNGTLSVTGSTGSSSTVTVASGATLTGTGFVNGPVSVSSGGNLSPGISVDIFDTGNASFTSGANFNVDLNGATVGTGYDQLNVTGSVSLGSSNLVSSLGYSVANGAAFTIINNDGTDAITGTFNGLPENTGLSIGATKFVISYVGGTGNDVVLTADTVAPSTTSFARQTSSAATTNADTLVFRVTFSEAVTAIDTSDFSVNSTTTATVTAVASVSSSIYDVTINGGNLASYSGSVGLNFSGSENITDIAGNALPTTEPSIDEVYTLDNVAPTLTINIVDTILSDSDNTSDVTFVFSKNVSGFDASDITVVGGAISNFSGSGTIFTASATFTATDGVTVTGSVSVAAGAAADSVGNLSEAASDTVSIDTESPTLAINIVDTSLSDTDYSSIVTFVFSESVTGFTSGDVTVSGGTLSQFSGSGTTYSATLTATDGVTATGSVSVAAGAAVDSVGNLSESASDTVSVDTENPSLTINIVDSALSDPDNASDVTFVFSESVTGFTSSDVTVSGGTLSNFSGSGASYTAIFTANDGITSTGSVSVASNAAVDAAGNLSTAASDSVAIDTQNPTLAVNIVDSSLSDTDNSSNVTFVFSESVTGFTASDVSVSGGTLSKFSGSGTTYSATFTATDGIAGSGSVSVPAGAATDAAGNSTTTASDTVTIDTENPTLTINIVDTSLSDTDNSSNVTFIFSESVTGFTASDITVSGGTVSKFSGSGATYSATFTAADGITTTGSVSVANSAAIDGVGNLSVAGSDNVAIDTENPTLVVDVVDTVLTKTDYVSDVTFEFSESVTGFTAGDISVVGGAISNFSGSGKSYTATLTATDGLLITGSVSVAASAAVDLSGNSSRSGSDTVSIATVFPTPTINIVDSLLNDIDNTSDVTIVFTSAVVGFDASDLAVVGGAISNFTGSGTTYSATFTATDGIALTGSVGLTRGAVTDDAGNACEPGEDTVKINTQMVTISYSQGSLALHGTAGLTEDVLLTVGPTYSDVTVGGKWAGRAYGATNSSLTKVDFVTVDPTDKLLISGGTGAVSVNLHSAQTFAASKTGSLSVTADGSLTLGASNIAGGLSVAAGGDVTDSGKIVLAGDLTVSAPGKNIVLDTTGNSFGTISLTGANTTINESGETTLGSSTITGNLLVTSTGSVSQSGKLAITGEAVFTATGKSITLSNAANSFGQLSLTGRDVAVSEGASMDVGAVLATGTLSLTSSSDITDSGKVNVAGNTTLNGTSIVLDSVSNIYGTLLLSSSGDVTIYETGQTDIGNSTIGGKLTVSSLASVTDSGKLDVTGATSVTTTSGNAITLDNPTSVFVGAISLSGPSVTLQNAHATELANVTAVTSLKVTSSGPITNSGPLTIGGPSNITAVGQTVDLSNPANVFGSLLIAAGSTTIVENSATDLGSCAISGSLSVTSGGAITDSGGVVVSGLTTLVANSGTSDINLDSLSNDFGTLAMTGSKVVIVEGNAVGLAASSIGNGFSLTSNGAVTQVGTLTIDGATSISSKGNVTLADSGNSFDTLLLSGVDVAVSDVDATDIGSSKISGTLTVISGGDITDSGKIFTGGITTLTAKAGAGNINLDTLGSSFGPLHLTAANVEVNNTGTTNLGLSTVNGTLNVVSKGAIVDSGALTVAGDVSLTSDSSGMLLTQAGSKFGKLTLASGGGITLSENDDTILATVSGKFLTVTSTGDVTSTGPVSVDGRLTVNASSKNVTLSAANSFGSLSLSGANAVIVNHSKMTELAGINLSGSLQITTSGEINDTGKTAADGTTIQAGGPVTLDVKASSYGDLGITATSAIVVVQGDLSLDACSISGPAVFSAANIDDVGDLSISGSTALSAGKTGDITLDNDNQFGSLLITGNNVVINEVAATDFLGSTIAGILDVTSKGAVTQSSLLSVAGAANFSAAGQDITLNFGTNTFGSSVSFLGRNVAITDSTKIDLIASTASGSLTVIAGGDITDSGVVTVGTTTSLTAGRSSIVLDQSHQFGGSVSLFGSSVSISGVDSLTIGTMSVTGNVALSTTAGGVALGPSTIGGTLNIAAAGSVTESGVLTVRGNVSIDVGATHGVLLSTTAGHNFGTITISKAKHVSIQEVGGTNLGAISAAGDLDVVADGAVTDSGVFDVGGATTINAGRATITLDKASNFGSSISLTGGSAWVVNTAPIVLGTSDIAGALTISTTGAVSQVGVVVVTGTATISAGASNDVSFDLVGNSFGMFKLLSGRNLTINEANSTDLGESTISGALSITSGGAVNDMGKLTVTGTTTIAAAADVLLDTSGSKYAAPISVTGVNVTVMNAQATDLSKVNASGAFTLTSLGDVVDSGTLTVGGTTKISATKANVTINDAKTALSGAVSLNGINVSLVNNTATVLAGSTASGTFSVTTNNFNITSTVSALAVTGAVSLDAGTADINVALRGSTLGSTLGLSGHDITVTGNTALNLGPVTATGNLSIVTTLAVDDTAKVNVAGSTTVNGGNGPVSLNFSSNVLNGAISLAGTNLAVTNNVATVLGTVTAKGTLSVLSTSGDITDSGTLVVSGLATFNAGNNDIVLDTATSTFGSLSLMANDASVVEANAMDIATSKLSGNLNLSAPGAITDSGVISVTGTTTVVANNFSSITWDNAGSTYGGDVSLVGQDITIKAVSALSFGATSAAGKLTVVAGGDITDNGAIVVLGNTNMNAGTYTINLDYVGRRFVGTVLMAAASVKY